MITIKGEWMQCKVRMRMHPKTVPVQCSGAGDLWQYARQVLRKPYGSLPKTKRVPQIAIRSTYLCLPHAQGGVLRGVYPGLLIGGINLFLIRIRK